jgi:NitT/TauT family transport system substrate-binding protein
MGHQVSSLRGRARKAVALSIAGLAIAGVAVISATSATASGSLQQVTFRTGFGYGPWDAGYAVALDKGYYTAAGLSVKVLPGLGSASNVQLVAANQTTFAAVAGSTDAIAVQKGAPVKAVASFFEIGGNGVATITSIKSPAQMVGHTFAGEAYDFGTTLFPAFETAEGLNPSKIHVVLLPASAIPAALERGQADMMTAAGWAEVPEMKADGTKFNFFPYAKYGLNTLGPAITVNNSTLASKPAMVKAFAQATAKGFAWTYAHPAAAAQIVKKEWPTTNAKYDLAVAKTLHAYAQTPATKGKNLGWMAGSDFANTIRILVRLKQMPAPVSATKVFANVLPENG